MLDCAIRPRVDAAGFAYPVAALQPLRSRRELSGVKRIRIHFVGDYSEELGVSRRPSVEPYPQLDWVVKV